MIERKSKGTKTILSWLLAALLILGGVVVSPVSVYAAGDVAINETNFPSPVIRAYVKSLDTNNNDILEVAEGAKVTELSLDTLWPYMEDLEVDEVGSTKGIEYFPNLEVLEL